LPDRPEENPVRPREPDLLAGFAGYQEMALEERVRFEEYASAAHVRRARRLEPRQLELVCDAVRRQIQDGVRLSNIAALVRMSPSQFSRSFR
jgi:transcriptional regulator GlxA family with amidase domain